MPRPNNSTTNAVLTNTPLRGVCVLSAVLISSFLVGCSTLSGGASEPVSLTGQINSRGVGDKGSIATNRSRLVARDLVGAMIQIPELDPAHLVLSFSKPESSYGRVLALELQRAGYEMRVSNNRQVADFLDYSIRSADKPDAKAYEFIVSVGSVRLKRSYVLEDGQIFPVSSLYVLGVSPENIAMHDDIFIRQKGDTLDGDTLMVPQAVPQPVAVVNSEAGKTAKTYPTKDSVQLEVTRDELLVENRLFETKTKVASGRTIQNRQNPRALGLTVKKKENMYETRQSNFADLWDDYIDVRKEILVFNNDSSLLGRHNKNLTRQLIKGFNSDTDVISVIGCSHGKTALSDGNRKLALGRSSRVREELILSGIDPGYVLDEGCWAPRYFDAFPRRGVVLTLKRLRVPG